MTKSIDKNVDNNADDYTDKRTGIVYANVNNRASTQHSHKQVHTHLDAFIPDSFLKTYFAKGKSKLEIWISSNMSSS